MKLLIFKSAKQAGEYCANKTADILNECIKEKGSARIVLSTGASQFAFFDEIVKKDVDWSKVEMFHLDEYIGIAPNHFASFQRYLQERFVSKVNLKAAHFVSGIGDIKKNIQDITCEIQKSPIDIGLIGIGENAHIAFNDPPADFEDDAAYKVVELDEKCRLQQVNEGWFKLEETVGLSAISMTCKQIMKCKKIISFVPYAFKAQAVKNTLENPKTPLIPATLLKEHQEITIVCDKDSASLLSQETIEKFA